MTFELQGLLADAAQVVIGAGLIFVAAFVALDLLKRADAGVRASGWAWSTGAGLALATGIWSAQVMSVNHQSLPIALSYRPEFAFGTWFAAWVVGVIALSVGARRGATPAQVACGAFLLAVGLAASQTLFFQSLALRPGVELSAMSLVSASACALGGCWTGLRLYGRARRRERGAPAWQAASAGLITISLVASQALVAPSGHFESQASEATVGLLGADTLQALAVVAWVVLLSMLLLLSQLEGRWRLALQRTTGELQTHALRDALTELPNRQVFEGTLTQAAQRADATQGRLALLLVNLDGFKLINESLGHRAGDRLLREVASRLRSVAQNHMVARLGGDEFLLLMPDNPTIDDASAMSVQVLTAIGKPCRIDGPDTAVTGSIGVVMYPQHGALSTLIAHADAAMRGAKASGGATYCFFEARMVSGMREQTEMLRDLRRALAQGELQIYYQPKIDAPTGEITGAEALMRWQHPKLGMVSPTVFIPIAERFGLIASLGSWLIDEVCRQIRVWRDSGLRMRVAINLSVHQLRQPDLVERIARALREHEINPGLLTCEITETVAMEDTDGTIAIFGKLAQLGVSISIDDFGTGHSSLAYLRKLPASELKIDRSFVLDLETSEDARKVASAVINLAKALDLKVVAEGVETEGQNKILREFGCDQLQGFLFAKPMSAKALALWAMDDVGPRTINFRSSLFKDTRPVELV